LRYARLCRSCLKTPVLAGQDADACQIVTSPADRIPVRDQQMGTLTWCIDQALRAVGGASAYLLTDNARTVTMDHVAGIPVRHPEMVALGRHYGCKVETCVPFDPESRAGPGRR
jgi:hypothetical protein